jgi:enamine deaminase RidA (YjgF/YER057c/UK114 family)
VGLLILGSLQRELGDLDRITGSGRVCGMVNCAPGFDKLSELILGVFGPEVGRHARSAIGLAGLPFNFAVEIEAEGLIRD